MFGKRKNSAENLSAVEGAVPRRPHNQRRDQSTSTRLSFHGSESSQDLSERISAATFEERKKKYATAPMTNQEHAAARRAGKEKPPIQPKSKNLPQATYQKTFISLLKSKDSRSSKKKNQETTDTPLDPSFFHHHHHHQQGSATFHQPLHPVVVGQQHPSLPDSPQHAALLKTKDQSRTIKRKSLEVAELPPLPDVAQANTVIHQPYAQVIVQQPHLSDLPPPAAFRKDKDGRGCKRRNQELLFATAAQQAVAMSHHQPPPIVVAPSQSPAPSQQVKHATHRHQHQQFDRTQPLDVGFHRFLK